MNFYDSFIPTLHPATCHFINTTSDFYNPHSSTTYAKRQYSIVDFALYYAWARAKHFGCHYPRCRRWVQQLSCVCVCECVPSFSVLAAATFSPHTRETPNLLSCCKKLSTINRHLLSSSLKRQKPVVSRKVCFQMLSSNSLSARLFEGIK